VAQIAPLTRREYRVARNVHDEVLRALDDLRGIGSTLVPQFDERRRALAAAIAEYESRGWYGRLVAPLGGRGDVRLRAWLLDDAERLERFAEAERGRA
jgi:hypothetical protein